MFPPADFLRVVHCVPKVGDDLLRIRQSFDLALTILLADTKDDSSAVRVYERAIRRPEARNGKIFNIFSLVRIGERSGMGLSSLYGVWEKEKFTEPSIVESYEPDRTKVTVEYEPDEAEVGVMTREVIGKTPEVIGKTLKVIGNAPEVIGKTAEVKEKTGVSDDVKTGSDHVKPISDDVNRDFEVLMGAYRSDFREKAWMVFSAFVENPGIDIVHVAQKLNMAEITCRPWTSSRARRSRPRGSASPSSRSAGRGP